MLAPYILAFDCSSLSQDSYDDCIDVQNSNLSIADKDLIIVNLDYDSKFYPDHDYVWQRNTAIRADSAPLGVIGQDGIFVRDAWVEILSVMPSVMYNGSLYCPGQTKVLSAFNYSVEIPRDYSSDRYPETSQGDCMRTYSLISESSDNKVYASDVYQGNGRLVDAGISADSELRSEYSVHVSVDVDHYRWHTYCCAWVEGRCVRYCHDCDYSHDETLSDDMAISDAVPVKYHDNTLYAELAVTDSYGSTTKLRANYSDSVRIGFQDSLFEFNEFVYDIDSSQEPYNVYTLRAEDYYQGKSRNILRVGDALLVKNTDNCSIRAYDFFSTLENGCNLAYQDVNLSISTGQLTYKPGEQIRVDLHPSNLTLKVSYGEEVQLAQGTAVFTAKRHKNRITASYDSIAVERTIFVSDGERGALIWNLTLFGLVNYLLYAVGCRYWGGFL